MAYVNSSRTVNISMADRFGTLAKSLKLSMQRRRLFNQTVRELNALSDRELADLGIHSSMIKEIAKQAAYSE